MRPLCAFCRSQWINTVAQKVSAAIRPAPSVPTDGTIVSFTPFSELVSDYVDYGEHRNLPVFLKKSPEDADRELMYRALFEIKKDIIELKDLIVNRFNVEDFNRSENRSDILSIRDLEKDAIIKALDKTKGSKRKAARLLNISERTLYRKLKEYDITVS